MRYKNRKKEAVFLDIYEDKNGKETFQYLDYEIVDKELEDGKTKKDVKWIYNEFLRKKPMNRKARRLRDKNNRAARTK